MQHGKWFILLCRVEVRLATFHGHTQKTLFGLNAACTPHAFPDSVPDTFVLQIDQQSAAAAMSVLFAGVGISGDVPLYRFDNKVGELLATSVDTTSRTYGVDLKQWSSIF